MQYNTRNQRLITGFFFPCLFNNFCKKLHNPFMQANCEHRVLFKKKLLTNDVINYTSFKSHPVFIPPSCLIGLISMPLVWEKQQDGAFIYRPLFTAGRFENTATFCNVNHVVPVQNPALVPAEVVMCRVIG